MRRNLLLSKIEETVTASQGTFELSCNLFDGAVHPNGFHLLEEFRLDPGPTWVWNVGGVRIEKSLRLVLGENTVAIEYRLLEGTAAAIELRPLIAFRDYHSTTHANGALNPEVLDREGIATIQPYSELPLLYFFHTAASLRRTGDWYYRFQYPREKERGLDFEEDLFQPFALHANLTKEKPLRVIVSTEPGARTVEIPRGAPAPVELAPALRRASQQFLIARGAESTVIAGYHWFTDWGRDTFISLPGLAPKLTPRVVLAFLPFLYQGLLPNRFPDAGAAPEYNSTDATLWFVQALRSVDDGFVREHCWQALRDIVEWRERGTLYGIRVDSDGLLTGGAPGVQLTWMDAKAGDRVITERAGKPVEIQALWYNALLIIADFGERFGEPEFAGHCRDLAARALESFACQFWNPAENCLFDVVNGAERDGSIRPNQIFTLSLPHRILAEEYGALVLEVVKRELLTPFGLRTLSPRDSRYQGRYGGDQSSRDGAYHQGTVWPWLLGPYAQALVAVHGRNETTTVALRALLEPFEAHLLQAGIGQISEIFDGDPPHAPQGCIAQAWSVGEILRIATELGD